MPFKRVLLYLWISLLFLVALFFVLRNQKPTSTVVEKVKLKKGVELLLYKGAQLKSSENTSELMVLKIEGKTFIKVPSNAGIQVNLFTNEAEVNITEGSAVIDASIEYKTQVYVATGQVSLNMNRESTDKRVRTVEILPGEIGIISPNARGVVKQNNRDANYLSWVDFNLTFENDRLTDIIELLQETYGVQVSLNVPNHSQCRYTGTFQAKSFESVIATITDSLVLTITELGENQWEINGEGC